MQKILAKRITDDSFILKMDIVQEKIGILVDYKNSKNFNGVELFLKGSSVKYNSLEELQNELKFDIEFIKEKETISSNIDMMDYPIMDGDSIIDVQICPLLNVPTFRKSERSKVRFYAGWWLVPSSTGELTPRCTISIDTYEKNKDVIQGPYKTFMELNYNKK